MSRNRDDACPGALQVHQAADGALARVRLPGGALSAQQLAALARVVDEFGSGTMELTARGNIQLRGIADTAGVARAVATAGLLPSPEHERVRNIVASPLSGRTGGLADIRPWISELDAGIQADADLADLPGRFLFGIDDGRGDISPLLADVGIQVVEGGVTLLLAGRDTGIRLAPDEAVAAMLLVAQRFARTRQTAWRIAELPDVADLLAGFYRSRSLSSDGALPVWTPSRPPVGWIQQDDGRIALGAAVPLGVLPARQAEFVAAIEAPVIITPWRSLLICDLDEGVADTALRVLAPLGLVFDINSPWLDVTSCVGSPGCERSRADVRAAASAAAEAGSSGGQAHYVGCERACGSPTTGHVMVATGTGFERISKTGDETDLPRS